MPPVYPAQLRKESRITDEETAREPRAPCRLSGTGQGQGAGFRLPSDIVADLPEADQWPPRPHACEQKPGDRTGRSAVPGLRVGPAVSHCLSFPSPLASLADPKITRVCAHTHTHSPHLALTQPRHPALQPPRRPTREATGARGPLPPTCL